MTRAGYYGRRALLQPGHREWVTAIECIGASGFSLPPMIITSDEIGLRWLQKIFLPSTFSRVKGKYRLLVLDGHGSH